MSKSNYTFKDKLKAIGPGAVVTASFIGPGTITTASSSGAEFGYSLLWAVVFSIITTIILQEMSARIGIITGGGLGEAINREFDNERLRKFSAFIIGTSITIGCASYISGDLTGTAMGLETLVGAPVRILAPIIGVIVGLMVIKGSMKFIEKFLTFLVAVMAVVFLTTLFVIQPDWSAVFQGLIPSVPDGSIVLIISLIGTTVVPYNFFIHAGNSSETWSKPEDLELSRWDTGVSITVGGLITAAIIITSGTVLRGSTIETAADLSLQLEPVLGSWAGVFMSIGLFAAGLSSATAAPLGAAYTLAGLFGWDNNIKDKRFRNVVLAILIVGIIVTSIGFNPVTLLLIAQALNGIILPVIAIYVVYISSSKKQLGEYRNHPVLIGLGILIAIVTILLGLYALVTAISGFL